MKQIIVMRADLKNSAGHKVRSGKLMAQAAHASMGAVLPYTRAWFGAIDTGAYVEFVVNKGKVNEWLADSFTKIVVSVGSEEELLEVHRKAKVAGLIACLITDNGTTEFGGVPTNTCCAIGPDTDEALSPITGALKLY
ncbi:aminoacyl-tRNA hydrolase [Mycolicibacterium sp. S2-37]|uniref:aminoacyl-tRNA hydrolase n=1 Tax=Mycolicibacterium sp. S2-37 TaxID=2810297 RepID=UPI001A94F0A5|nr:aminoacyl-tRNA hydrolase [Mycolicibacterium sp. S2-37]MBO0676749.1 aminoacyl-tRNA hydrolase [Mycolicibacterium sp. S2-37]